MKRIFVAIDISDAARLAAADHIEDLRAYADQGAATWVRPEKLHVTLRFFAHCSDRELTIAAEAANVCAANTMPFVVSISGTGVFPSPRRARVLWLGIKGDANSLAALDLRLEERLVSGGLAARDKPFAPHLTIARIKNISKCRNAVSRHLAAKFQSEEFTVNELVVYQSTLDRAGSIYNVLSRHHFGKPNIISPV